MTHQELTRTTPWVNPDKGKQPGWLAGGLAVAVAGTAIAATLELRHLGVDPAGDPGGVRQQTLRSISVAVPSDAKVQNHSVGPPIWDSCDGRPDTQGWSYVINAYQFTSARCPATVVAGGCHQLITPAPRFNRSLAPCPRRAQTAGDSRPIASSSGCPRPAQSSGPPRWIARIKLVPKLIVRVRFPSPAPHAKSVATEACPRSSGQCQTRVSVLARATLGHTYPHLGTHPSASEDAQLVSSCSPASVLRSSNVTQRVSPQYELDVNGLNYNAAKKRDQ
jgi:hypothetical protein